MNEYRANELHRIASAERVTNERTSLHLQKCLDLFPFCNFFCSELPKRALPTPVFGVYGRFHCRHVVLLADVGRIQLGVFSPDRVAGRVLMILAFAREIITVVSYSRPCAIHGCYHLIAFLMVECAIAEPTVPWLERGRTFAVTFSRHCTCNCAVHSVAVLQASRELAILSGFNCTHTLCFSVHM